MQKEIVYVLMRIQSDDYYGDDIELMGVVSSAEKAKEWARSNNEREKYSHWVSYDWDAFELDALS